MSSLPRSQPVNSPANDDTPRLQASIPRTFNHRRTSSISSIPRPITQHVPTSANYSLSNTLAWPTNHVKSWSHSISHHGSYRRGSPRSPKAQQPRRDSQQENKLFEAKPPLPTPESVRELTHDGSTADFFSRDPDLLYQHQPRLSLCSKCDDNEADSSAVAGTEHDLLSIPPRQTPRLQLYTDSLGVPGKVELASSPMLSVISDAGDQQQKRQKHIRSARSSVNSDFNLEESLPNLPAEHELQGHLVDARQETWVNEHLQKFIPKEELWRIVNIGSVYRVLAQKLLQVHPPEQIMKYAKKICKETEVIQGNEKLIKSYRKIFSILVLLELASSILHFLEEDVSDLDLPIERLQETEDLYRKGDRDKTPLKCFKRTGWSPMNLEDFQHKQWWMLAPFFSRDEDGAVKHYVLQNQHVLPFSPIPASNRETGFIPHKAGGYGKVLMVQINSQHHNFHDMMHSDRGFAVKQQIDFEDRDAYKKEIAILKRFTGRHSDHHIVSLLASYEQFNKFHLIFHRAEGTLHELWTEFQTNPGLTQENILWMAEQCAGLASALSKFHRHFSFPKPPNIARVDQNIPKNPGKRFQKMGKEPFDTNVRRTDSWGNDGVKERPPSPISPSGKPLSAVKGHPRTLHRSHSAEATPPRQYGRHGDINPRNVLWYNDGPGSDRTLKGTLKLTDFGQAELNSSLSRTKQQSVATTRTYRPPECDLRPSIINQSYDIWCLGCVLLEFTTWMLGGDQLLQYFFKKKFTLGHPLLEEGSFSDIFFKIVTDSLDKREAIIKPEVSNFIEMLHELPNCSLYFHELLVLIQHDLLVVDSGRRMLCIQVWIKLDEMHQQCRRDSVYAMTGSPWKPHKLEQDTKQDTSACETAQAIENVVLGQSASAAHKAHASRIPRPKVH